MGIPQQTVLQPADIVEDDGGTGVRKVKAGFHFTDRTKAGQAQLLFSGFETDGMSMHQDAAYERIRCYGYGAGRIMNQSSLLEAIPPGNSASLFSEHISLVNAEEWLLQLDYSSNVPSDVQEFALERREKVKEILIELLPGVEKIRFTEPTKEKLVPSVEFRTHLGWVSLSELNLGYKCMIAWLVDFAYRMFERYPQSSRPLEEPAIVLIDEIDLHLHPKWQRKIFDFLGQTFPATQFIVTAHSPLIVQSAPYDANLVLLRKQGNHIVIDQNMESVRNWRIDQILTSELFDIPVRNAEVEMKLERRRELISQDQLTPEETSELQSLNTFADNLPYAESELDIKARAIIRKAAAFLNNQKNIGDKNDPDHPESLVP